ncbi:FliM/FliN family flagellar motor switch protein [Antarcticirhabdus aurantiaca]|uniref:FliM/FliN family flagellar motor switch protein n=1 Tax=Antarcticirhabdus aurantiaca TaxID=2606717 RepID=A0ACD4NV87_9HYPH|nr:FliM/FliN family flagellar motor switch protein [Antarcticirhabdus aurantiaca]WAJ30522.1 FliM/FliN family flagellar motor switch protein [Jeongeuplla avenae]
MTLAWFPSHLGTGFGPTELWNGVAAAAGTPLPLTGTGATLAYALCEPPPPEAAVAQLRLPPLAGPTFVQILDFPFRERFGVDLSVPDLGGLPDGLRLALIEGILETARAMLPPALAADLVVEAQGIASGFPTLTDAGRQWFELDLRRADGLAVRFRLGGDRASIVAAAADHLPPPFGDGRIEAVAAQIPAPVDMTLGTLVLTLGELRALAPGAVVVLAERPAGLVVLRAADHLFEFTDSDDGWRCSGPRPVRALEPRHPVHRSSQGRMMDEASRPDEADDTKEDAGEALSLGDLRVAVDFDLGRSMLPLSTIASWQRGALVELGSPTLDNGIPVTIRVNGDLVGSGDLVRIDDRVAVRITRLSLRA